MELQAKVWIPFANQNGAIVKLKNEFPQFFNYIDYQIYHMYIPIAFDYEGEITESLSLFFSQNEKPFKNVPELQEYQRSIIAKFNDQRLLYLQPTRMLSVNGVLGLECIDLSDGKDFWLPKEVKLTGNLFPTLSDDFEAYHNFTADELESRLAGTVVYSFIVEAFN